MKIRFENKEYTCRENETVLESLMRLGIKVPFSCRNGVCRVCLLRSTNGQPPANAQKGIKQNLVDKGYFMSCKCTPEKDMDISRPRPADILTRAVIYEKKILSKDICRLLIEPATQVYYRAGQFINLKRSDGLIRSYSLASVPHFDNCLEIHVKRIAGGKMSEWIFNELKEDDEIEFHGPLGNCYYYPDKEDEKLLLISTGLGISPHIGIAKDALISGHSKEIKLYHGTKKHSEHYLYEKLKELVLEYPNFSFHLCASAEESKHTLQGRSSEIALQQIKDIQSWQIYLSGNPEMVTMTQEKLINLGVDCNSVLADPFEYDHDANSDSLSQSKTESVDKKKNIGSQQFPDPDPEMWRALDQGKLMTKILTTFYSRVFEDKQLKPYFQNVTQQRLIEKVYNFHYQMFTGEKVYFGDHPKNAHHWMVISDELFDHREKLMETCLREHGLAEHLIERWMEYEEMYRDDIIKAQPANKIMFGEEMPSDGFDELVIETSTLCDSCSGEIIKGSKVRYHTRLGSTYCGKCMYEPAQ
jgi:ferredoxin-NADP reductase/ferredoxin/truncated hemoglobin YjbI